MQILKFFKIRCACGHLTLIPTYGRLIVTENINCEECNERILETKVCAIKKSGKRQAKKVWNKLLSRQCPGCGKQELWPCEDIDGNPYFHCEFCHRDFEEYTTELGAFISRADIRPEMVSRTKV